MKISDAAGMCLQNLMRRKARTFLTVLGVIVGCCSIVIMISIGVGMQEAQAKTLASMGDLTLITVYNQSSKVKLDESAVAGISKLKGVEAVTPKLSTNDMTIKLYAGENRRYVCEFSTVTGMDVTQLEKLGYKVLRGEFPKKGQALCGESFAYAFADSKRPEGMNTIDAFSYDESKERTDPPDAYFDPLKTPVTIEIEMGENGKKVSEKLDISGVMKEDYGKGDETSQGLALSLDFLSSLTAKARLAAGVKANDKKGYENVIVKVSGIDKVADAEKAIKKMGFKTNSMESIRKPMEAEARQKQLMLGGLGAISLFVAALGITNTMIMSISERTREIGVMKSLGCYVRDIRRVFLMEAGTIGFMGGVVGLVLSFIISAVMNAISANGGLSIDAESAVEGSAISIIPPWLALFALAFSVLIGLGSGYYPARRAVAIPALEAIKHE